MRRAIVACLWGLGIYAVEPSLPLILTNHLPDALWAFALAAALRQIWGRSGVWASLILAIAVEAGQAGGCLPGTGCLGDATVMALAASLAGVRR